MKDDRPSPGLAPSGWLERLSQAVLWEPRDRDQLIELLRNAHRRELLDLDALAMIEGVFDVSELQARDIMVPRSRMVVVERNTGLQEMLPVIIKSAHSRFPVIGDSRDEIVGILLAKDLLRYFVEGNEEAFDLQDIIRRAVFIPESKRLNVLLKEFRNRRNHLACVVDEYGGVSGLVTIEDVLEQIVGDIDDEHDVTEDAYIFRQNDARYTVKALTPIEEFNDRFGTQYSDQEFDTIGGLVMSRFGHLPKRDESIDIDNFNFKILRADNRRIHLLQMVIQPRAADSRSL